VEHQDLRQAGIKDAVRQSRVEGQRTKTRGRGFKDSRVLAETRIQNPEAKYEKTKCKRRKATEDRMKRQRPF
jgi:hypothetical protein